MTPEALRAWDEKAQEGERKRRSAFCEERKDLLDNLQWLERKVRKMDPSRVHGLHATVAAIVGRMHEEDVAQDHPRALS